MTQVLKRGGGTEDWDHAKVLNSIVSAGVSTEEAEKMVANLEVWATAEGAKGPLMSGAIRAQVMQALQAANPAAATAYGAWKKATE